MNYAQFKSKHLNLAPTDKVKFNLRESENGNWYNSHFIPSANAVVSLRQELFEKIVENRDLNLEAISETKISKAGREYTKYTLREPLEDKEFDVAL
jgi:thiaminase